MFRPIKFPYDWRFDAIPNFPLPWSYELQIDTGAIYPRKGENPSLSLFSPEIKLRFCLHILRPIIQLQNHTSLG